MGIYVFLFLAIFAFCFLSRKHQFYALAPICVFLALFIGFRHGIGGDWKTYMAIYRFISSAQDIRFALLTDPAYGLLNYFIRGENGIYYINFICASILMWGVYRICKMQPHPIAGLLIFLSYTLLVVGMGYTRQSAAIGLLLVGFSYLVQRRVLLYITCVVGGAMFHLGAIVALPLFIFFVERSIWRKYIYLLVFTGIILVGFVGAKLSSKLSIYTSDMFHSSGGTLRHLMNSIPAVIFLFHQGYFKRKNPIFFPLIRVISLLSLGLLVASPLFSTLTDRIAQYFTVIQVLVYPVFVYKFKWKDRAIVLFFILLFYFVFLVYWFNNSYYATHFWIPYQNFLFL